MQMDDDPPESVTRAQHLIWFYFLKVLKYIYFYNWTRMLHVHRRRPHINNYSFYPYIIALHCGLGLSLLVMVWKTLAFRFLSELVTTFASNPLFCSLPLGVLFLLRFIFELVSYPRFYFQLCVYVSRHDRSSGHSETNINLIKKFYNCELLTGAFRCKGGYNLFEYSIFFENQSEWWKLASTYTPSNFSQFDIFIMISVWMKEKQGLC